jgi:putative peptidoglycan lipid II flippase
MWEGIGRSSLGVTLLTILSVALGMLNQILIAKYYGATRALDSYLVASAIPFVISGIALSLFSSIVVPSLTEIKKNSSSLSIAVSNLTWLAIMGSATVMVLGVLGKRFILEWATELGGEDLRLASRLAGYIWIGTGLAVFTSFLTSLYYLNKEFAFPALLGLLPTVGTILGAVILSPSLGIEGLVIGWVIAVTLALLALWPVLRRHHLSLQKCSLGDRHVKYFIQALWPVAAGLVPFTVLPAVDAYWTSTLPEGSMAHIGYCTKIVTAVASLIVSGIYVVILPYLSEHVVDSEYTIVSQRLQVAIKYVLIVTIPSAVFLLFFGKEVVSLLLQRGKFSPESAEAVSSLLPFYLIGLLAMTPSMIVSRGYVALQRSRQFGLLGFIFVALYWIMAGILSRHFSVHGIGFAYALYWILFFSAGVSFLQRPVFTRDTMVAASKCTACSIVSSGFAYIQSLESLELSPAMSLLLKVGIVMALFILLSAFFRIAEMGEIKAKMLCLIQKRSY